MTMIGPNDGNVSTVNGCSNGKAGWRFSAPRVRRDVATVVSVSCLAMFLRLFAIAATTCRCTPARERMTVAHGPGDLNDMLNVNTILF